MSKFKTLMKHTARKSIAVSWLYDAIIVVTTPYDLIKTKNIKCLYSKTMLAFYGCIALTGLIYFVWLFKIFTFWVAIFLFFFITAVAEAIKIQIVLPYKRYDPEHNVTRSDRHPYGNRRFMTAEDEEQVFDLSKDINAFTGMILGCDERGFMVSKKDLEYGNNNEFCCGNSGTKKGVSKVIPKGLQTIMSGKSGVIASTKDDNYAILARIAHKHGYLIKVCTFRPGDLIHSDGIDFMKIVNGSTDMALMIATCITQNTSVGERPDYWYRGELSLLFALILMFSIKGGTIVDVYSFLCNNDLEQLEAVMDMLPRKHPAFGPYRIFKRGKEAPKAQVLQGLGLRFSSFMADENIQQILSHDDVRFEDLGKRKCLYFIVVSDKSDQYKALSSTFFSLLFFSLGRSAEDNGGCLDNPVEVVIDEAFAVGAIPKYAGIVATSRGYGINITTIVQSIPQLKSMYPDTYESILNDSGIKTLIHTDDPMTAEYFSTLCGTFTGDNETKGRDGNKSHREASIPLMSVSDVLGKDINKLLVYITGAKQQTIILNKQLWYGDWPGSKYKFYNKKNGKWYHSHPLLKDFKYTPLKKHLPKWRKKPNTKVVNASKNVASEPSEQDFEYVFEETNK